jgi:hypothetical protein
VKLLLVAALIGAPVTARAVIGHGAATAPICTSTTTDQSALLGGAVTVSPTPGSRDTPPRSQISFLGVPAGELSAITVVGSASGAHAGRLLPYSQGDGASFVPTNPFEGGEQVTVSATLTVGSTATPLSFSFWVADEDLPALESPTSYPRPHPAYAQHFVSQPDLQPATFTVTQNSPAVAPGDVFLTPTGPGQQGPMIVDAAGNLVYFKALAHGTTAADFHVQQYNGQPVLTWWQGRIVLAHGAGEDVIYNDHYQQIASVHAGNGLYADLHEFVISPQNTAYLTAFNPIRCDLRANDGPRSGAVTDALFQEIDIPTGLVMYQWTSLAHVPMSASYKGAKGTFLAGPYDFFHLNSIDLDPDGSILISARNTWAVYDLNAQTGQINWTLGGKDSTIHEAAGVSTAWQHDARAVGTDLYSVFDNGASPYIHKQSRGLIFSIDPSTKQANLVSQFFHAPSLSAVAEGDLQQLPNSDWFIGWGEQGFFSEVDAAGKQIFAAHLPWDFASYRAFRSVWSGQPQTQPALGITAASGGDFKVYASWNGATTVAKWELLAGASRSYLRVHTTASRSGFETALTLPAGSGDHYVAVRALSATGATLATSALALLSSTSTS